MSENSTSGRDKSLRRHLLALLDGAWAHIDLASAVEGFPPGLMHRAVPGLDHTAWDLVYHLHAAQRDILNYLRQGRDYESPSYPEGYWPRGEEKSAGTEAWKSTVESCFRDLEELRGIVENEDHDLLAPLFPGTEHTLLREILVLADHSSYHIGQLVDELK